MDARRARDRALTRRNIIAGWAATGLFPFNPEKVLKGIQKPPPLAKLTVLKGNEIGDSLQDGALQPPGTPVTAGTHIITLVAPVTPITADALISLQNLID